MKKMILNVENLVIFIGLNMDLKSDGIPRWLIELNQRYIDPKIFENANEFNADSLDEIFDNALTAVWIRTSLDNDTGELDINLDIYENGRREYIERVRGRLDILYELASTPRLNFAVEPFYIFALEEVKIKIVRLDKTEKQEIMTEALNIEKKQREIDKDLPN